VAAIPVPSSGFGQPPFLQRTWEKLKNRLGDAAWLVVAGLPIAMLVLISVLLWRRRRPRLVHRTL
jgi:LPXTG-motif cell wall-anchored protein